MSISDVTSPFAEPSLVRNRMLNTFTNNLMFGYGSRRKRGTKDRYSGWMYLGES